MEQVYSKMVALLGEMVPVTPTDLETIYANFEPVYPLRGQLLVEEGKVARDMYFIHEGYLRTYYIKDGLEITNHINCPMGFMTAYNSYVSRRPSEEFLECITDCVLLRISREKLDALFQSDRKWARVGKVVNEQVIVYNEERTRDMIGKTAEERYRQLIVRHPDFLRHVPLQYIASYIGIKPESLSRIRRGIMN